MSKVQNQKSKFRSTSTWKKFRNHMKQKYKIDVITGKPLYKGWNLHHLDLDENHYTDISDESHFCCLNKTSHDVVHWLFRYKNWRDLLNNLYDILEKMEKLNEKNL